MFQLKKYQQQTLAALEQFLSDARLMPVETAYEHSFKRQNLNPIAYRHYSFGQVPYVCLRLPTGGGKTVLASHAVKIATHSYLEQDYPIVLWLVPTTTIKNQTLEALKQVGHPYRVELDRAFEQKVRVLDDDEVTQIRPQDIGSQAIVVVTTLANLRVNNTSDRKVYAYHEDFEPHFSAVNPNDERLEKVTEQDLKENGLGKADLGKIKYSFANLLALKSPLVIMDEAHNARTPLTFETLKRIHPACIIEFTATPDNSETSSSNVLYHVSAAELKAAEMIKLPIMLTEHNDWQAAVRDAYLTRNKLAIEAQKETDFIRPICLLQADKKNGSVPWQKLKAYLMDDLNIAEEKIAVVTGTQRELDGIDLFSPQCAIEFIITIEALKEGWDCSFAYVFCSVRDVRSNKDAEQLLGRVLRMPYAKRRQTEALNRAYAHLASPYFSQAAKSLTDNLVNMGFEAMEVASHIQSGITHNLFSDDDVEQEEPALVFELPSVPVFKPEHDSLLNNVSINQTEQGYKVEIKGLLSEQLHKDILKPLKGKIKQDVQAQIEQHNARIAVSLSPSEKGGVFTPFPQLCFSSQGELELVEPESFLFLNGDWSPLDFAIELSGFSVKQSDTTFEVDLNGQQISYHVAEEKEVYNLNLVEMEISENDLVRWLDRQLRSSYLSQPVMNQFLLKTISYLLGDRGFTLTALIRSKFLLKKAIQQRLIFLQNKAANVGFQQSMFDDEIPLISSLDFSFEFKAGLYPARAPYYSGRYKFNKHFYPIIEDIKVDGEEFLCAQAIDASTNIKHWVRNLVDREHASFRLPLGHGWFYPDFVTELEDGRILVIEYKGDVYVSNDDSKEKNAVGKRWAKESSNKCLFLMAVEMNSQGQNVYQQIDSIINE